MNWHYSEDNRNGDHVWYISDVQKFKSIILSGSIDTIFRIFWSKFMKRCA